CARDEDSYVYYYMFDVW
nr:immunoglobulin heavy chain junction region [Macaca mulatta]MOV58328.1 immunoglobulin heavy chain junction region [Macaca mulatta]MOV59780.1 immunoglobulin heavy chain junction region [Macaca mulatta]MOV59885.1 immunoglobulin heavy chain junction region [Macaca mulatta]